MQSKLPEIGTTIFTKMSKMASEYNAINLAQGFPNFEIDNKLVEIVKNVSCENYHQYAPMGGNLGLINEIKNLTYKSYNRNVDENEILITAGATQAIFTTLQALINTGDKVLIIDPSYDCYAPAVKLAGGIAIHFSMDDSFNINWNKLNEIIDNSFKMLIINNPHNPTGKVLNKTDFESLSFILNKNQNLILLSDEVYEFIVFEKKHISLNSLKEFYNRCIIISSFGKTFHITGWKIGYLIAPIKLMIEIKKVHQYLVFSVNSIAQESIYRYLKISNINNLSSEYIEKRNFFRNNISNSRLDLYPCEGTYFQCINFDSISNKNDIEFSEELVIKYGLATIPLSVFYKVPSLKNILRLCFAKDFNTLRKACEILNKL